ncbi:uncharacterized protein LOC120746011 [Simochromis diagramma]|uniref:uncharacterized protein LOC120746011 n=1 Tax=Simochromis diagramma TaxID=43689 RepID=UPI001A7E619C|nr:uncharacterized protein LOC120746011 [Simochromis diagramma]
MKCLSKNRHLKEKKREITKVRDDPISEGKTEEDTNYAFKSHDEEGEEDVRAGWCFFLRRPSCRTYCISDEDIRTELNTDDDNDDDGVCYRNISLPKEKKISADKRGFKILHFKWKKSDRKENRKPLSHNPSPSPEPSIVYEELKVEDSDFRQINLSGSFTPDYVQDQKSNRTSIAGAELVYVFHEMEDWQEEQNTSHQYTEGKCGEIKFGSTDLMGKTSSPCKSTGLPKYISEGTIEEDGCRVSSPWIKNKSRETDPPVMTKNMSSTNTLSHSSRVQFSSTDSCYLTRSHSLSSLTKTPIKNLIQAASLPDMRLKGFTPGITADESDDETYLFQCSSAGLYQCSVTGLVFVMKAEGDVVYRTVPWNRRLLAQHHKKPAGPLFDIKCQQQSVCQLCLPHCEVISTGGGQFLQVAHVKDEGIEFITPHKITESHAFINITGFSAYGNVKDEDSPPDPVQSLVLLFYKPPNDCNPRSVLSVFMLPRNIVFPKMRRDRKKSDKTEIYIETSSHCKLHPKQVYTLVTDPEHDLIKVQPKEADFDEEHHESYFPSFQVVLKKIPYGY